jgi:predicted PurR-regulated permease PerM
VERLAAYSWRLLVIAAVVGGALWVLERVRVVVLPLVGAVILTRALRPVAAWLERIGFRPSLAAATSLVALAGLLAGAAWIIIPPLADEFSDLPAAVSEGVDNVERWLVEDSPFDVTYGDLEGLRGAAADAIGNALRNNTGTLAARVAGGVEILAGFVLMLFATFFFIRDSGRFRATAVARLPAERRASATRASQAAWDALGGYLRGAVALGVVEGTAIGGTLALVGGSLALPVAVLTFLGAFVPYVGATVATGVAVLIALATTSPTGAIIVAIVALVVQQLDNELLAPLIYSRATQLHPLTVLLSIALGGALFGIIGSFLAVPVAAVTTSVVRELRRGRADSDDPAGTAAELTTST